jgi:hypothetical protein
MRRATLVRLLALLILLLVPSKQASAWDTCQQGYDWWMNSGCTFDDMSCSCSGYGTPDQSCDVGVTHLHCV